MDDNVLRYLIEIKASLGRVEERTSSMPQVIKDTESNKTRSGVNSWLIGFILIAILGLSFRTLI